MQAVPIRESVVLFGFPSLVNTTPWYFNLSACCSLPCFFGFLERYNA